MRHVVVVTALTSALTIPALEFVLPSWRVLPRSETVVMAAATSERLETPASRSVTHAEAPIAAPKTAQIDLNRLMLLLWGIGFVGLLMLLFAQMAAMQRAVRRAEVLADPVWRRIVNETCRALSADSACRPGHGWGTRFVRSNGLGPGAGIVSVFARLPGRRIEGAGLDTCGRINAIVFPIL